MRYARSGPEFRLGAVAGYDAGMNTIRKLTLLIGAAAAALTLSVGPVFAAEETESGEDHRTQLAETPRDRLGLLLLGSLVVGGGLGLANSRRQLKGDRPQASGEFRWR